MNHLAEDLLYTIAFDRLQPDTTAAAHLADCGQCRAQLAELTTLAAALALAQHSAPSAQALHSYNALFAQVQAAPHPFAQLLETIRATVAWNGRAQAYAQGVRNASATGYRMLYTTSQAEVELLIEGRDGAFTIEGEILPAAAEQAVQPMWIELHQADGTPIRAGESDDQGRFQLATLPAGHYTLYLLPPTGAALLLEALELA